MQILPSVARNCRAVLVAAAGKGADRLMDRFINEMAKDLKDQKQAVHQPNTVNGHPEIPNQNPTL